MCFFLDLDAVLLWQQKQGGGILQAGMRGRGVRVLVCGGESLRCRIWCPAAYSSEDSSHFTSHSQELAGSVVCAYKCIPSLNFRP